jgi:flagellar biosynthesis component FlhA
MNNLLNSYFVKTHRLEISITIIAIVLFLIYFLGAPHVLLDFLFIELLCNLCLFLVSLLYQQHL